MELGLEDHIPALLDFAGLKEECFRLGKVRALSSISQGYRARISSMVRSSTLMGSMPLIMAARSLADTWGRVWMIL